MVQHPDSAGYVFPPALFPMFCFGFAFLAFALPREWRRHKLRAPLPPGPAGWPLIGNTLDWPDIQDQVKVFAQWAEKYGGSISLLEPASVDSTEGDLGPIVHVNVMGQSIIILNSTTVAEDLLTKRSGNYSDRPYSTLIHDLAGYENWHLALMPYSNRWRAYRKHFHSSFRVHEVEASRSMILDTSREFLHHLSTSPEQFRSLIRSYTSKVVTKFVYGHEQPMGTEDPLVSLFDETLDEFNEDVFSKLFLVDVMPLLKHVPISWPGAQFKRMALSHKAKLHYVIDSIYERLQSAMIEGTAVPCVVTQSIDKAQQSDGTLLAAKEQLIKGNAMISFSAGTDTSASMLANFFLGMSMHPEFQKIAQKELDHITGSTRLPDFEDKPYLPFITAIFLESLRWNAPAPVGVPHKALCEDHYMGMRIPAGAVVIGNISAMLHEADHFEDPYEFNPSRFLCAKGELRQDLEVLVMDVFGFGRRICPGRHLAVNTVWIIIARVLATFHLSKALDADGNEIDPEARFTTGITSHPVPFGCRITPRNGNIKVAQATY